MKKATFFVIAAAALLAGTSAAQASIADPSVVTPLDTFTFSITGFNSAGTTGYLLTPQETATFGLTQTYAAAGINGQNITITSSEAVGASTTTDTFTVSTPTNFLTTAAVNGTTISTLFFELGTANGGGNTVDFLLPIAANYTQAGSLIYGSANTNFSLTVFNTTLSNGNRSLAEAIGVNNGTSAISGVAVHSFTYSITYANAVPEPSTYAVLALGTVALGTVAARRQRRAA